MNEHTTDDTVRDSTDGSGGPAGDAGQDEAGVRALPHPDDEGWVEWPERRGLAPEIDWTVKNVLVGKIESVDTFVEEHEGENLELPVWTIDAGTERYRVKCYYGPFDFLSTCNVGDTVMIRHLGTKTNDEGEEEHDFQTHKHQ